MIYLIRSSAYDETNDIFSFILKIGYTKDGVAAQKRFENYNGHNPTCKVLFKIPNGTRRQEGALHEYFKEFRIYNREWYEYREEIVEFFKTHTTAESLDSSFSEYKFKYERKSDTFIKVNKFKNFLKELEDSELKSALSDYLKISPYKRLKLLYDLFKAGLVTEALLENIPENNFRDYFNILGPDRIKACGYNITVLNRELGIKSFDSQSLVEDINNYFTVGERYSLSDVKSNLQTIYKNCGYDKSPQAKDLSEWFELQDLTFNVKVDGTIKRTRGYRILSKK
jgi:hypothetical protein